jgi:hypothetical protein
MQAETSRNGGRRRFIDKDHPKKAIASLVMLMSWKSWKERNVLMFRDTYTTSSYIVIKIKEEISLWSLAGAKALSIAMPRE